MRVTLLSFIFLLTLPAEAQFPTIQWEYYTGAPAFGSAASADMDNDGFYEIVFTTYTNDGKAHCLNAENGSLKWSYNIGGCGDVAPLIIDADNDGQLDVIINGSCNPTIFCINGASGQLKWSKPSGGGDSPPTATDFDNDGLPEILFCNFNGQLRIINGEDGSPDKTIQVDPTGNPVQTEPTLADLNNDGTLDILVGNYFNNGSLWVKAYDYASQDTLWTYTTTDSSSFFMYHGGAVADVDGDTKPEYVFGSNNGKVTALNGENGSVLWIRNLPVSNMGPVSIADLDTDGSLEAVLVNNDYITFDERIWVLDAATGFTEWSYQVTFPSFRGCAISDLNGNGILDLVSGHFMGDLIAVEPYTGLIWQTNLGSQLPPNLPYYDVDHGPLIADFDHDDTIEVFVVAGYGTYTPDSQNTGKAFLLNAGVGVCPEWLMFRQDVHRTGYLSQAEAQASCSSVLSTTETEFIEELLLYPNPASTTFRVEFDGRFLLRLFDQNGRLLRDIPDLESESDVDISTLSPGLYNVQVISAEGKHGSRMLVKF